MPFIVNSPSVGEKAVWGRLALASTLCAAMAAVPTSAQQPGGAKVDESVRHSITTGESTRVIMQFETTAERDAAFNRLLDRGAAVRTMDSASGPALNVGKTWLFKNAR